jgi:hypothetical protein
VTANAAAEKPAEPSILVNVPRRPNPGDPKQRVIFDSDGLPIVLLEFACHKASQRLGNIGTTVE